MNYFHALCVIVGVSVISFAHADGAPRSDSGTRVLRDVRYSEMEPCVGDVHLPASVTETTPRFARTVPIGCEM